MRAIALPFAAWLGVLESLRPIVPTTNIEALVRLVGIASVLGTLTVMIYRLGVWRQEMEHTKHDVGAEIRGHLERIERRLDAIDHVLVMTGERLDRASRWHARAERRFERLEAREEG